MSRTPSIQGLGVAAIATAAFVIGLSVAVSTSAAAAAPTRPAAAAAPVITGVAAMSGPAAGGHFVTLHGTGFTGAYLAAFGSVYTHNLHVWSDHEMTVRVPRHGLGRVYVRVAAHHRASAYSTAARYTYAAAAAQLVKTADLAQPGQPQLLGTPALSCVSATFCAAAGPSDVTVFNGSSWSPLVAVGERGDEQVSCTSSSFCMVIAGDGAWRYNGKTWTNIPGVPGDATSLDCGGPSLCGAVSGGKVYLYTATSWQPPAKVLNAGSVAISCGTATSCITTSSDGWYRRYQSGAWQAAHGLWYTTALRNGSLTAGTEGTLACAGTGCITSGNGAGTSSAHYALFTGSATSLAHQVSNNDGDRDFDFRIDSCTTADFCLEHVGYESGEESIDAWHVLAGDDQASVKASWYDISCWAPYQCIALWPGGTARMGRG